jgi:ribose transport system ATP-binding protein
MSDTDRIEPILDLQAIALSFPGVQALDAVDLAIERGEVHALVGENGAGKSSLVKLLCGIYQPDSGDIQFGGAHYSPKSPLDAIKAGIRAVYQEFNLLSYLSVAENIFFEALPRHAGFVDFRTLHARTEELLREVGLEIAPTTPVELLGIAQMQLIEIAKAISTDSKVLILDEPTATLTPNEIEKLFAIILKMKAKGVTVLYISHRLQEIFEIADRVTVLRNGKKVGTKPIDAITVPEIVRMMVGKEMGTEYPFRSDVVPSETLFEVRGLRYRGNPQSVSFAVKRHEILGIAGLVGAGRTETVRAIFGADDKAAGQLFLRGAPIEVAHPRDAVRYGICLLTEDRKNQGLILDMACAANITITDIRKASRGGFVNNTVEREESKKLVERLAIHTTSVNQLVRNLSGGNQQKVVLAKWLFRNAEVLILDEPTRGIDVGAKFEIYLLLWELAALGKGIIIVSSELPELMGICHRMLVFSNGRITGELERKDFDQERILKYAFSGYIAKERT